eukprot:scaffold23460_cov69-Phaeocystis_antarctica.AAC.3
MGERSKLSMLWIELQHRAAAGRWMTFQGQFNVQTHLVSLVLVHVGVGQRRRAPRDVESSAILPTMSKRNLPAPDHRTLRYVGST